jgi:hypothetical protein
MSVSQPVIRIRDRFGLVFRQELQPKSLQPRMATNQNESDFWLISLAHAWVHTVFMTFKYKDASLEKAANKHGSSW